jgi:hypothetical protein
LIEVVIPTVYHVQGIDIIKQSSNEYVLHLMVGHEFLFFQRFYVLLNTTSLTFWRFSTLIKPYHSAQVYRFILGNWLCVKSIDNTVGSSCSSKNKSITSAGDVCEYARSNYEDGSVHTSIVINYATKDKKEKGFHDNVTYIDIAPNKKIVTLIREKKEDIIKILDDKLLCVTKLAVDGGAGAFNSLCIDKQNRLWVSSKTRLCYIQL